MTRPRSWILGILRRNRSLATVPTVAVIAAAIAFPLGVIASHRFSDVPNTNTYHADIDALADAGVTTGCGNGTIYCPSDFVTREQMAAFMNRLGALAAGKTPVVNADKLDGLDSTGFVQGPVAGWRAIGAAGNPAFECLADGVAAPCTWDNIGYEFNTAAFYKDPLGVVHLKGVVSIFGTFTEQACQKYSMFTLPTGYRPTAKTVAVTLAGEPNQIARIDILPDGRVTICVPDIAASIWWFSLDGISFRAG